MLGYGNPGNLIWKQSATYLFNTLNGSFFFLKKHLPPSWKEEAPSWAPQLVSAQVLMAEVGVQAPRWEKQNWNEHLPPLWDKERWDPLLQFKKKFPQELWMKEHVPL